MTNQQIEIFIKHAEKSTLAIPFLAARIGVLISLCLTPLMLLNEVGAGLGALIALISWGLTYLLWWYGKDVRREMEGKRAQVVWKEVGTPRTLFGYGVRLSESQPSRPYRSAKSLLEQISDVYELDPRGEILPLKQALRLVDVWKTQRERLFRVEDNIEEMKRLRTQLLEKQKSLVALGDDSPALSPALASLDDDIGALEDSGEELRASCARLEALVSAAEAVAKRRQLHREIDELAQRVPAHEDSSTQVFDDSEDNLDLERQISREIETYLMLEAETNAHLRDL